MNINSKVVNYSWSNDLFYVWVLRLWINSDIIIITIFLDFYLVLALLPWIKQNPQTHGTFLKAARCWLLNVGKKSLYLKTVFMICLVIWDTNSHWIVPLFLIIRPESKCYQVKLPDLPEFAQITWLYNLSKFHLSAAAHIYHAKKKREKRIIERNW